MPATSSNRKSAARRGVVERSAISAILNRDIAREAAQRTDAEATIERLQSEAAEIALTTDGADDVRAGQEHLRTGREAG